MNRGSATLKASLYEIAAQPQLSLTIKVDRAPQSKCKIAIKDARGASLFDAPSSPHPPMR